MNHIEFFKDAGFYQRLLSESYQRFLVQSGKVARYSIKGRIYEVRDCNGDDIANIALRDGQVSCLFLGNQIPIKRLTASQEKPDMPIGFYLVRDLEYNPEALELFFNYVSPNARGEGISLLQKVDVLISALLTKEAKRLKFTKVDGNSSFYESLDGICSSVRIGDNISYDVDITNKEKVKEIIDERLAAMNVRIIL